MDGPSRQAVAGDITEGIIEVSRVAHALQRRADTLLAAHLGSSSTRGDASEAPPDPDGFVPANMVRLNRINKALEGIAFVVGKLEESHGVVPVPEPMPENIRPRSLGVR